MNDQYKTKKQLIEEVELLRKQLVKLKLAETKRQRVNKPVWESEETFKALAESANDGIVVAMGEGLQVYVNKRAGEITGYSVAELLKKTVKDLMHPDELEKAMERYRKRLAGEAVSSQYETTIIRKDGKNLPIEITGTKTTWHGQPANLVIIREITDRKRVEAALRESEERYRRLVDNSLLGIGISRGDHVVFANPALLRLFGYEDLEEFRKIPLLNHVAPASHKFIVTRMEKIAQGEPVPVEFEYDILCKDGQTKTLLASSQHITLDGGTYTQTTFQDISERKNAEEALRNSEEKYRTILENIEEGYYEVDIAGNFTFFNDSLCRIYGYAREELMGMNDRQYTDQENAKKLFQTFNRVYGTGEPTRAFDWEIIRKDGTKRDIEASVSLIKDSSGNRIGFRGLIHDITERKQAEEKLRESETQYRDLIETARDVIFTLSPQGMFTSFNRVFETITGWSTKEWIGKVFVDLLDPNDVPKVMERFKRVMAGQLGEPIEVCIRTKYGRVVYGELVATPQVKEGKVIGILVIARDITERKKADEALRQERDFSQTLVQASPLFFVAISPDGKTLMMNQAMLHSLGYTADEVVGKDYLSTFVPVTDREMLLPIFQRLVNQKKSTFNENRVLAKDGRELLVEWHGRPVFKANGDLDYFFGVGIDITQRRQAAEEMASLQDQLRQSQKMEAIGQLAGGVAHDFNNLLTVIKGYCQLSLTEMKESTPIRNTLEVINEATEKAAGLTRQLLAFSRRQIMQVTILDLNTLLQNLDKMLRRIIGEDIELITLLGEDLGRVKADPGQIEQVVMNLAVNAKDAMSKGGQLTIETANIELDEAYARAHIAVTPGPYVMIAVSDTGTGMAPEVRDRVFEPFFTTKGKGKGTGLGLSTVYGIVKQSGGNIWVYSELGQGTTLKIYLPRVDEPAEKLKAQVVEEEFPRGSETILIVEDDKEVRNLASRILKRQGYTVLDGSYGAEAFNVCRQHRGPIHLLVTDVVMPGMDGRALSESLSQLHPEMKVLYMSGYTDNSIVHHGMLGKGINFLQKPFTVDTLAKKVREVLDKNSKPTA